MSPSPARSTAFRQLLRSRLVGGPLLLGGLTLLTGLMQGDGGQWAIWTGLAGVTFGLVAGATQWLLHRRQLTREAELALSVETERTDRELLNQLRRRLERDGDERTEQLLARLQRQTPRLHQWERQAGKLSRFTREEIAVKAKTLFAACIQSLERALTLGNAAREMATPAARQQLLDRRETLLAEVDEGILHLEATLDYLSLTTLRQSDTGPLGQIQNELELGLKAARHVEAEMEELERLIERPLLRDG